MTTQQAAQDIISYNAAEAACETGGSLTCTSLQQAQDVFSYHAADAACGVGNVSTCSSQQALNRKQNEQIAKGISTRHILGKPSKPLRASAGLELLADIKS